MNLQEAIVILAKNEKIIQIPGGLFMYAECPEGFEFWRYETINLDASCFYKVRTSGEFEIAPSPGFETPQNWSPPKTIEIDFATRPPTWRKVGKKILNAKKWRADILLVDSRTLQTRKVPCWEWDGQKVRELDKWAAVFRSRSYYDMDYTADCGMEFLWVLHRTVIGTFVGVSKPYEVQDDTEERCGSSERKGE